MQTNREGRVPKKAKGKEKGGGKTDFIGAILWGGRCSAIVETRRRSRGKKKVKKGGKQCVSGFLQVKFTELRKVGGGKRGGWGG